MLLEIREYPKHLITYTNRVYKDREVKTLAGGKVIKKKEQDWRIEKQPPPFT